MHPVSQSDLKGTFVAFREQCIWLQRCFNTFNVLFEGGEEVDALLRKTASMFFADLNTLLVEYWVLVVCRLTDPASTKGNENLTVSYLLQALRQNALLTPEIEVAADEIQAYRKLVNDSRNKVVSHADRKVFLRGDNLGEHSAEDIFSFVRNLQKFNDLVGEVVGEGPLDYQVTSGPGDAIDLLRVLRSAT